MAVKGCHLMSSEVPVRHPLLLFSLPLEAVMTERRPMSWVDARVGSRCGHTARRRSRGNLVVSFTYLHFLCHPPLPAALARPLAPLP